MHPPGRHIIVRSLAAALMVAVLAACAPGPDLKASLTATAGRFYADLAAGQDPYASSPGLEPLARTLPVSSTGVVEATVTAVTAPATGGASGQWSVHALLRVGASQGQSVTYTEITRWTYRDRTWKVESVEGRDAGGACSRRRTQPVSVASTGSTCLTRRRT